MKEGTVGDPFDDDFGVASDEADEDDGFDEDGNVSAAGEAADVTDDEVPAVRA